VHGESKIRLARWRQNSCQRKTRIINEDRVIFAIPLNRAGWIGDDGVKEFIIPVLGIGKRVTVGDIKLFVVYVVQKHIDPAKVIGGDVFADETIKKQE